MKKTSKTYKMPTKKLKLDEIQGFYIKKYREKELMY